MRGRPSSACATVRSDADDSRREFADLDEVLPFFGGSTPRRRMFRPARRAIARGDGGESPPWERNTRQPRALSCAPDQRPDRRSSPRSPSRSGSAAPPGRGSGRAPGCSRSLGRRSSRQAACSSPLSPSLRGAGQSSPPSGCSRSPSFCLASRRPWAPLAHPRPASCQVSPTPWSPVRMDRKSRSQPTARWCGSRGAFEPRPSRCGAPSTGGCPPLTTATNSPSSSTMRPLARERTAASSTVRSSSASRWAAPFSRQATGSAASDGWCLARSRRTRGRRGSSAARLAPATFRSPGSACRRQTFSPSRPAASDPSPTPSPPRSAAGAPDGPSVSRQLSRRQRRPRRGPSWSPCSSVGTPRTTPSSRRPSQRADSLIWSPSPASTWRFSALRRRGSSSDGASRRPPRASSSLD